MERLQSPDPAERVKEDRTLRFMGPRAAPAIPNLMALLDGNPDLRTVEQRHQFLSLNPTKPSPRTRPCLWGTPPDDLRS